FRRRATGLVRTFQASRIFHGATRARLPRAAPIRRASSSVEPPVQDWCVCVDAAVTGGGPVLLDFFHLFRIAFDDEGLFFCFGCLGDDLAEGIGDEGRSPELDPGFRRALVADSIHGGDEDSVCDGVRALDGLPRVELSRSVLFLFRWMPADRGGIKQNVG